MIYLLYNNGLKVTCIYCDSVTSEDNEYLCEKCIMEGFN